MAVEGNAEVLEKLRGIYQEVAKGKITALAGTVNDGLKNAVFHTSAGNEAVLGLVADLIHETEKGKISSLVYTLNDGVRNGIDWIGIQGNPEYMMMGGLFELMNRINKQMWDRQPAGRHAEVREGVDFSRVIYAHPNLTLGFDFLPWIVAREMDRVKRGGRPLEVTFAANRPIEPKDKQMLEGVCGPLTKMIGGVVVNERPPPEALWYPTNCFEEVVEFTNQGLPLPEFVPEPWAVDAMASYRGVVTITLREAEHWKARNGSEDDWREIAYRLRDKGETVVIVRDTAKAKEPFHGFLTVPHASEDLQCRAALYAVAKCNLFIANGPATLDWFCGNTPSLTFIPLEDDPNIPDWADGIKEYKCSQLAWWKPNHGIEAKTQFPFFKGRPKKIVWKWPSVETVMKEYEEHMNAIQVESAGKVGVHPGGKKGARRHEKGRPVAGGNGQEEIARAS